MDTIVKLSWSCGMADLLVNGQKVKVPKKAPNGDVLHLHDMVKRFAEDAGMVMIAGDRRVVSPDLEVLANRLDPYWPEVWEVLGIEV